MQVGRNGTTGDSEDKVTRHRYIDNKAAGEQHRRRDPTSSTPSDLCSNQQVSDSGAETVKTTDVLPSRRSCLLSSQTNEFESAMDNTREGPRSPFSSMSSDAGVSSSLILFPSYKNLKTTHPHTRKVAGGKHDQCTTKDVNHSRVVIQMVFMDVPNCSNVFSDLVRIRRLKLRKLRVSLDFKEDLISGRRQNLQIQHHPCKRREIEAECVSIYHSDRPNDMSKGRADLNVDRVSISILSLRRLVFGLLGVGHGTQVYSEVWRVYILGDSFREGDDGVRGQRRIELGVASKRGMIM